MKFAGVVQDANSGRCSEGGRRLLASVVHFLCDNFGLQEYLPWMINLKINDLSHPTVHQETV